VKYVSREIIFLVVIISLALLLFEKKNFGGRKKLNPFESKKEYFVFIDCRNIRIIPELYKFGDKMK
jgi:hypothetical protein